MAPAEEASTSDEGRNELQIELRPAEGGYQATVRWPNGETTSLEHPLAVEPAQVDETLARVGRGKSKWIARDLAGGSLDPVRALGEQLFRSLIEGGLGSRYHQAVARAAPRDLRVCLATADRRLADLPWELLYDLKRQDFVALSVRTPLVRRWLVEGGGGAPAEAAPLRGPLRLLVVDASGGASGARSEVDALHEVGGLGVSNVVKAASASQLLEAVARGTEPLLHVIGPPPDVEPPPEGRARAGESRLACAADALGPRALLDALGERARAGRPPLCFAFWSGGHTDAFARDVAPGLAASAGVRDALTGSAVVSFVAGLYRALAAGRSLATAFTEARQRIDCELPGNREWVLPVLYLQRPAVLGPRAPSLPGGAPADLLAAGRPSHPSQVRAEVYRRNLEALQAAVKAEAGEPPEHLAEQLAEAKRLVAQGADRPASGPQGPSSPSEEPFVPAEEPSPRASYPLPGEGAFRRLLRATLVLHEQGERLARLDAAAEPLRRNGLLTLPGELALLDALRALYQDARALLHAMDRSKSDAGPHLAKLERKLTSVEWELAGELEASLGAKVARFRALVDGYKQRLSEATAALDELRQAVAEAGQFLAPVEHELGRWRELDDLRRSAERALRDAQYEDALGPLARLRAYHRPAGEGAASEHHAALQRVREKQAAARAICRQADLLFLRSPRDGRQRYRYTVILRTPVETGSQGVNVQASTTLIEHDRQDILDAVKEFTGHLGGEFVRRAATRDVAAPAPLRDGRPVSATVRDVGELMYGLLMPEEMRRYVDETRCSLTITTNDLELPWELMFQRHGAHDEAPREDFLCVSRPVARLPMGHAFPRRDRGLPARRQRLRFLLIHSNPGAGLPDLPGAMHEVQAIYDALTKGWQERIHVTMLDAGDVTGKTLNRILREGAFDVIHYAGHAYADDEQGDLSGLVLKGGEVFFAQKVRRLLEGRPLVFLNACQSAAVGGAPAERPGAYAQAEGLASAFLYGGAVACIGSLWPIYDVPAAAFAVAFYKYVLEGNMIGEAMRLARCDVRREHRDDATWAAFVLYGNPTYRHTLG